MVIVRSEEAKRNLPDEFGVDKDWVMTVQQSKGRVVLVFLSRWLQRGFFYWHSLVITITNDEGDCHTQSASCVGNASPRR